MATSGKAEEGVVAKTNAEEDSNSSSQVAPSAALKPKHPLHNSWTFWFFRIDKSKSWAENLRKVITCSTVEDFWGVYNHILLASRLQSGCDYSFFKEGIEPMWEDEKNRLGGRWLINLSKSARNNELDKMWLEILMCLIGESFGEDNDTVNGAVVNIRNKGDKIGLWTQKADEQDSIMRIGRYLKERLNLPQKALIGYQSHLDTAGKTGSTAKNKYTL